MSKVLSRIALALIVGELLLCLASWVVSALCPDCGVRSVFSGEGVRWLFGRSARLLSGAPLVWLLMASMAWGLLRDSRLVHSLVRRGRWSYRERSAIVAAAVVGLVLLVAVGLLVLSPHALLASASGHLWPSPFSAAIVPLLSGIAALVAIAHGVVLGVFHGPTALYRSILRGIASAAPLFLFYILINQLRLTLLFVLQ